MNHSSTLPSFKEINGRQNSAASPSSRNSFFFFFFFFTSFVFHIEQNEKSIATAAWETGACWGQLLGRLAGSLTKQENGLQIAVCFQMSRVPPSIDYVFRICEGQQWLSIFLVPAGHVGLSPVLLLRPATALSCHGLLFSVLVFFFKHLDVLLHFASSAMLRQDNALFFPPLNKTTKCIALSAEFR